MKNEIAESLTQMDFYLVIFDEKYKLTKTAKLALSDLATMCALLNHYWPQFNMYLMVEKPDRSCFISEKEK